MENDPMMSSPYHTAMNNDPLNKSGYNTCNLQLNSNSNPNNASISNNILVGGNDTVANTNHHAMMKSNNNVMSNSVTSDSCNKLQLREHPNLNVFISNADGNNRNVNDENIVKDDNYKNHLMNGSQKFNLNNKHISCHQQQQQQQHHHQQQQVDSQTSISYGQIMNDINRSSLPLNLCQVSIEVKC
jgi:hypothetical protein